MFANTDAGSALLCLYGRVSDDIQNQRSPNCRSHFGLRAFYENPDRHRSKLTTFEYIILAGVSKIAISDHYLIYGVRKFSSLKANTRIIEFRDFKNFNERAFLDDIRSIGTLNLHQYASANEM